MSFLLAEIEINKIPGKFLSSINFACSHTSSQDPHSIDTELHTSDRILQHVCKLNFLEMRKVFNFFFVLASTLKRSRKFWVHNLVSRALHHAKGGIKLRILVKSKNYKWVEDSKDTQFQRHFLIVGVNFNGNILKQHLCLEDVGKLLQTTLSRWSLGNFFNLLFGLCDMFALLMCSGFVRCTRDGWWYPSSLDEEGINKKWKGLSVFYSKASVFA